MGYLTKMNGKYGQNGFSAVGFSILGQPPRVSIKLTGQFLTNRERTHSAFGSATVQ